MDAFDDVLRNRRDAVPPQAFYERLVQILARRRDPLPLPRAERELAERQAAAAADAAAEGPRLQKNQTSADQTPNRALALTTAAADERLVRLAVDVFRRVHAEHPATALVRPAARLPFVLTRGVDVDAARRARRGGARGSSRTARRGTPRASTRAATARTGRGSRRSFAPPRATTPI